MARLLHGKYKAIHFACWLPTQVATFGLSWFCLPAVQHLFLPDVTPGGWLIKPHFAFRIAAALVASGLLTYLIISPIRFRLFRAQEAAGVEADTRLSQWIKAMMVKGTIAWLAYAFGLAFYFSAWTIVDGSGIRQRALWIRRDYAFKDVARLETIPNGYRNDAIRVNGPTYSVLLKDGYTVRFDTSNDGLSEADVAAIVGVLTARTGMEWVTDPDSRVRLNP